jgi:hypothetical protein
MTHYTSTHPPIIVWPEENRIPMTIGIGVLAGAASFVIVASDTRASYPKSAVDPNDFVGKQTRYDDIPRFGNVVCTVAGRLGVTHDVEGEIAVEFKKLVHRKKIHREHVQNAIDRARSHELRRRYDWALRVNLGVTMSQVLRGKLPSGPLDAQAMKTVRAILDAYQFQVELIVAGFIDGEPILFKGTGKEDLQGEASPAVYVIGSKGKIAAMDQLSKRGQNVHHGLARSILHVHEAAEAARRADPDYIGKPSWYTVILRTDGVCRLNPEAPLLKEWAKLYRDRRDTGSLDEEIPERQIRALLRKESTRVN